MSLDAELQALLDVRGVTSACVVGSDGVLIGGAEGADGDLMRVADLVPSALGSSRVLAGLLGDGEVSQALVEFDRAPVLLIPLTTDADAKAAGAAGGHVAVLTLSAVADLGRVRFRLKTMLPRLVAALPEAAGSKDGAAGSGPGSSTLSP